MTLRRRWSWGGVYVANANLQWMAGLRVVPRSAYPVIPAVGVRWKFAPEWTLNFFLPDPRVQYDINDRLKAYLGMSFRLGTFTLADRFGDDHQQPDLNGVEVDYFEMLLGPGVSWKIRPNLTLDLNAGCLAFRAFAFNTDRDLVAQSEPAPYVQLMCLWVF